MRLIAALALVLISAPAFAACITIEQARDIAREHNVPIEVLSGGALAKAVAILSEPTARIETIVLASLPDGTGVVAVGPHGSVCAMNRLDSRRWRLFRNALFGERA